MQPILIYLAVSMFAVIDRLLHGFDGRLAVHTDESQDGSCVRCIRHDFPSRRHFNSVSHVLFFKWVVIWFYNLAEAVGSAHLANCYFVLHWRIVWKKTLWAVIQMLLVSARRALCLLWAGCMVYNASLVAIEEADLLADATKTRRIIGDSNALVGHEAVWSVTTISIAVIHTLSFLLWLFFSLSYGRGPPLFRAAKNGRLVLCIAMQHWDVFFCLLRRFLEGVVTVDENAAASVAADTTIPLLGSLDLGASRGLWRLWLLQAHSLASDRVWWLPAPG